MTVEELAQILIEEPTLPQNLRFRIINTLHRERLEELDRKRSLEDKNDNGVQ